MATRFAALAAIASYVSTAHQTKGHEADFGKQWLAARLVATGQGPNLFDPSVQRTELERHFTPATIEHGIWRDGIGGPTYPPTLAVVFAPLGWLKPAVAQWVVVQISMLLVVVSGRLIARATSGRISPEAATLATLSLPSFFFAVGVGQNSAISLAILAGGFVLLAERRDFLAGVVWGLFAIKPTWGLAVVWIPAVTARPRAFAGIILSAGALVATTLPICGVQAWLDWLAVARQTEHFYEVLPRWTALSRDLPGLLRRVACGTWVEFAGWAAVWFMIAATGKAWWCGRASRREPIAWTGPRAVALAAAAVLSCPRFMFYDMTLAVVPFLIALAGWSALNGGSRVVLATLCALVWIGPACNYSFAAMQGIPLETLALLVLWLWSVCESHGRATATSGVPTSASCDATPAAWSTKPA